MTDSLLNADAMQKFIAKIFTVTTRSLIPDEPKERERQSKRTNCNDVEHLKLDPASWRDVTTEKHVLHRIGPVGWWQGVFRKRVRTRTRRGATNRLAGFNRGSSSRETD